MILTTRIPAVALRFLPPAMEPNLGERPGGLSGAEGTEKDGDGSG